MGLMDRVKEQAAAATAMAKDAAEKGQAKLDDMQAKRAAEVLLRDLGLLAFAAESGRAPESAKADTEKLVAALHAYENEHGRMPVDLQSPVVKGDGGASA